MTMPTADAVAAAVIELNACGVTELTAGQVDALPAWELRGWRFLALPWDSKPGGPGLAVRRRW